MNEARSLAEVKNFAEQALGLALLVWLSVLVESHFVAIVVIPIVVMLIGAAERRGNCRV